MAIQTNTMEQLNKAAKKTYQPLISIVLILLIWELIADVLVKNKLFLAPPTLVWGAFIGALESGKLLFNIYVSFIEFILGFVFAIIVGVGLGFFWALTPKLDGYVDPIVSGAYSAPLIALSPLFILWFGVGVWSKVAIVFLVAVFPILLNTVSGIRSVDPDLVEVVTSFNANRKNLFSKVLIPWSLPFLMSGVRLGLGRGLNGIVVGELFGARAGLGYMITQASLVFNTAVIFLGVLIFVVGGAILVELLKGLERRVAPWREEIGQ